MENSTNHQTEEIAEHAPRYLDQALESRDHANQWDVSLLMVESKLARNDEAE